MQLHLIGNAPQIKKNNRNNSIPIMTIRRSGDNLLQPSATHSPDIVGRKVKGGGRFDAAAAAEKNNNLMKVRQRSAYLTSMRKLNMKPKMKPKMPKRRQRVSTSRSAKEKKLVASSKSVRRALADMLGVGTTIAAGRATRRGFVGPEPVEISPRHKTVGVYREDLSTASSAAEVADLVGAEETGDDCNSESTLLCSGDVGSKHQEVTNRFNSELGSILLKCYL